MVSSHCSSDLSSAFAYKNTGIVHQDVQPAEALDGVADQTLAGARGAQIGRGEVCGAARGANGAKPGAPRCSWAA